MLFVTDNALGGLKFRQQLVTVYYERGMIK